MIRQLIKAWERVKEVHASDGKIFIRGAGNNGRKLLYELTELGVKVSAFIDTSPMLIGVEIRGVPVISPGKAYTFTSGEFFIMCSINSGDAYAEIRREMEDRGLVEGGDFADFGLNCDYRMYSDGVDFRCVEPVSYDRRELNIHRFNAQKKAFLVCDNFEPTRDCFISELDYPVTTYCSLRCEGCCNLIPEYRHLRHFDPETIVSDLEKLLSVSQVGFLGVLGGEPLLHPRLADILYMLGRLEHRDNLGKILCVTNGTIRPPDSLLDALSYTEAVVCISDYGTHSPHAGYVAEVCEKRGIHTVPFKPTKWGDLGDFRTKRNRSEDDLRHLYAVCTTSLCYPLFDGRLYSCAHVTNLYEEERIPADPNSCVDIRNLPQSELAETLCRYLNDTPYLSACDYCDGYYPGSKEMPRARQLRRANCSTKPCATHGRR